MKAVVPHSVLHNFPSASARAQKARQKEILLLRRSSFEKMQVYKDPGGSSFSPSLDSTPVPLKTLLLVRSFCRMPSLKDVREIMKIRYLGSHSMQ